AKGADSAILISFNASMGAVGSSQKAKIHELEFRIQEPTITKQPQLTAQNLIASALNYYFLLEPFHVRFRYFHLAPLNLLVVFADQGGPAPDLARAFGKLGKAAWIIN